MEKTFEDRINDAVNANSTVDSYEAILNLAREADAALAASQHIIDTQRRVYDETLVRLTALNAAKGELIAFLLHTFAGPSFEGDAWDTVRELHARIRSLESE